MNCSSCSAKLRGNETFCPQCGAAVRSMAELVALARQGDEQAISDLYGRTYNAVYASVRAKARIDEDTVLDVVQDAYVKGFQSLNQLQNPEQFQAWMKTIALNRLRDVLKRNRPTLFSELSPEEENTVIDFEDERVEHLPDIVVDRQETARLMGEILDTLSDEQRMAVVLYFYEEMSVREIANLLECSENTVKSRLSYARKKIKAQVEDMERRGTKLYGLAPLPFLLLLLRNAEAYGPSLYAPAAAAAGGAGAGAAAAQAGAAGTAASGASGTASTAAAGTGVGLVTKIVAGVLAVALAAGGGAAAAKVMQARSSTPAAAVVEPETEEGAGERTESERENAPEQSAKPALKVADTNETSRVTVQEAEQRLTEKAEQRLTEAEQQPKEGAEDLYAPVLDMLYYNSSTNWEHVGGDEKYGDYTDHPLKMSYTSFVCNAYYVEQEYSAERMGYYFDDLDGNGTPELIIGADNQYKAGKIIELYTCRDGTFYHLASTGERWDYTLNKDNSIVLDIHSNSPFFALYRIKRDATSMTARELILYEEKALSHFEPHVGADGDVEIVDREDVYYYPEWEKGIDSCKKISRDRGYELFDGWLDPKDYSLTHFSDYTPHSKTPAYVIDEHGNTLE